jgi:prepilin-type processing-associated H-X9-DG protein/prepilin-type N-terminal cleavage/methylation domain-containing protein
MTAPCSVCARPRKHATRAALSKRTAFTLLELLAVISIVAILGSLLLPSISAAKGYAGAAHCKNNLRQLQLAFLTYSHDNNGWLVPNKSRDAGLIQRSVPSSWVLGNAKWDSSPTNIDEGLLWPDARSRGIYHCPTDASDVKNQRAATVRLRSYSLDGWLGTDFAGKGMKGSTDTDSRFKSRLESIRRPAQTFGFIDENSESIDDGFFLLYDPVHWSEADPLPEYRTWFELPSDRHNQGCNLSFLDGHVDGWKWQWPKRFDEYEQRPANDFDKADLQRLQRCLPN